jgi:hypothetical protein
VKSDRVAGGLLRVERLLSNVLGLRYFACEDCDAVHADVDEPAACGRCGRRGSDAFADVTATLDDASATYFSRAAANR